MEVAADLPVWTLAHVMGVPEQDRRLLFDWASRVIGYQDAEYAQSSSADADGLSPMGRAALVHRPDSSTRPITRSPNDHVSFGFGPHFCLGAHLARTQMRVTLRQILARLPRLRTAGEPVRLTSNFQNGLKHLELRWDPQG